MTPKAHHKQIDPEGQATLRELLQEKMKVAIQYTLIQALEEEVEAYVQAAPYERTPNRRDHRNGTYPRGLGTSMGEIEDLPVPRTRKGFQSQLFERYRRRQAELDESICQMFVQGVSTEKVGRIVESLSGSHPSPSTVSRVFHTLEEEFATWKKRPLQAHYLYVIADGTYFSVIYDGEGSHMPILALIGIDPEGKREVLGFSTGDRENQQAWEALLTDLKDRGLETVDLWISDGGKAMINAIEGEGVGALRTLTSADGSAIVERLETLDAASQRLSYALLTDTPFTNCLTTMAVRDLGPNQAELAWSATFQPDGLPASEAVDLLESALAENCLALKQFMEMGRK